MLPVGLLGYLIVPLEGEVWRWWKEGLRLSESGFLHLLVFSTCLTLGRAVHPVKGRKRSQLQEYGVGSGKQAFTRAR